ncbi:MAG: fructosamine kinase family protein [Actinomycetota bacterium]|nr:fructosamine kinase family protein [Actinomycetota bacterium]
MSVHPLLEAHVRSEIERAASLHLGRSWKGGGFTDLNDRASHPCGVVHGRPFSVFAKFSLAPGAVEQFTAERDGLALLRQRAQSTTPTPIGPGVIALDHGSLLLFEALEERPPEARNTHDWRSIGHALAALHVVHDKRFGLDDLAGFFGPLAQDNRAVPSNCWADFYAERRVAPRLRSAVDAGRLPTAITTDIERLVHRLPELCGPEPRPSLLHGDAQQNNFVSAPTGAVIVDAAPYFGHPEVDLALVDYFAPVPDSLFDAYRERAPIDPGFAERRELWRVFAYLAVIAVDGESWFGRRFVARLADAVRIYT